MIEPESRLCLTQSLLNSRVFLKFYFAKILRRDCQLLIFKLTIGCKELYQIGLHPPMTPSSDLLRLQRRRRIRDTEIQFFSKNSYQDSSVWITLFSLSLSTPDKTLLISWIARAKSTQSNRVEKFEIKSHTDIVELTKCRSSLSLVSSLTIVSISLAQEEIARREEPQQGNTLNSFSDIMKMKKFVYLSSLLLFIAL